MLDDFFTGKSEGRRAILTVDELRRVNRQPRTRKLGHELLQFLLAGPPGQCRPVNVHFYVEIVVHFPMGIRPEINHGPAAEPPKGYESLIENPKKRLVADFLLENHHTRNHHWVVSTLHA